MKDSATSDLQRFLLENVANYDELEALLLLQRQPALDWDASAAAEAVGLPLEQCEAALESLAGRGLVAVGGPPPTFRYAPASRGLAEAAEQLRQTYAADRFAIVQLMTTNAMDRVRAAVRDRIGGALQLKDFKKSQD